MSPEIRRTAGPSPITRLMLWAVLGLLALYAAGIFSLRLLPTQDGPVLLYYCDVFRSLLAGGAPVHSYYAIGSMGVSHVFFLYFMAALLGVLKPLAAEKLFVVLYLAWMVVAFRYLVRSIDPSTDLLTSLLGFSFLLNSVVYFAFYDLCISIPTVFFACGYWLRVYRRLTASRWLIGFLLMYGIVAMHPVGAAVFLMFVGSLTAVAFIVEYSARAGQPAERIRAALLQVWKPLLFAAIAGIMTIVALVLTPHPARHLDTPVESAGAGRVRELLMARPLSPYESRAYRALLGIASLIVLGLFVAAVIRHRRKAAQAIALWTVGAVAGLCVLGYLVVPGALAGGQAYLPMRFAPFGAFFVLAGAAQYPVAGRSRILLVASALLLALSIFAFQMKVNRSLDAAFAPLLDAPPAHAAKLGAVVVEGPEDPAMTFEPQAWVGANYIQRSGAALLDNPWLGAKSWLYLPRTQTCQSQDPRPMADCLLRTSPADRPPIDLLVDVRAQASDPAKGRQIALEYGLTRQICQSPTISIYSRPEAAGQTP